MTDHKPSQPPRGAKPFLGAGIFLMTLQVLCSLCAPHYWGIAVVGALLATVGWAYGDWLKRRKLSEQGWLA